MTGAQDAMQWLKGTFGAKIDAAVAGTPFSRNLLIAIAMQETSYIWISQYKTKTVEEVLALCVGDTIDAPRRKPFPKTRADLEAKPNGDAMFKIAREALERVATVNTAYEKVAKNSDKFCHGFGMFQYDLQAFLDDPDYFLKARWATFDGTLGKCVSELREKLTIVYGSKKTTLTHDESVYVAIAYNNGNANLAEGFKQGHQDGSGKYYGENVDAFLKIAEAMP